MLRLTLNLGYQMYDTCFIIESSISYRETIRNFDHPVLPQCHIHLFLNHFLIRFYLSFTICRNNVIFFSKCQYPSQLHTSSFHISAKTFQCVSQNRQSSFLSKINCIPPKLYAITNQLRLEIDNRVLHYIFFHCIQRRARRNIIFIHAYQHIASKNS